MGMRQVGCLLPPAVWMTCTCQVWHLVNFMVAAGCDLQHYLNYCGGNRKCSRDCNNLWKNGLCSRFSAASCTSVLRVFLLLCVRLWHSATWQVKSPFLRRGFSDLTSTIHCGDGVLLTSTWNEVSSTLTAFQGDELSMSRIL